METGDRVITPDGDDGAIFGFSPARPLPSQSAAVRIPVKRKSEKSKKRP